MQRLAVRVDDIEDHAFPGRRALRGAAQAAVGAQVDAVAGQRDRLPDEAGALQGLVGVQRIGKLGEALVQVADAGHGGELGHLAEELAGLHRFERILVLQLRGHQGQEVGLAEVLATGGGRRGRQAEAAEVECGCIHGRSPGFSGRG